MKKRLVLVLLLVIYVFSLSIHGAHARETIVIADQQWDSGMIHARIAAFIIEKGYGYEAELVPGVNMPISLALTRGKIQIMMESWHHSWIERYQEAINKGFIIDLGQNFEKTEEGWYVPTYVIKGDSSRGIKPMAPDLKSVSDLPRYWQLFKVPESSKGVIHDGDPGWGATKTDELKLIAYNLQKYFEQYVTGSGAALAASVERAYERGKPWLGYYWAPTWLLGKYDMTLLEEPAYNYTAWENNRGCAYPSGNANIVVHKSLKEFAPEVVQFLKNYQTTLDFNNTMLAYMRDHDMTIEQVVLWFLREKRGLWTGWTTSTAAKKANRVLAK